MSSKKYKQWITRENKEVNPCEKITGKEDHNIELTWSVLLLKGCKGSSFQVSSNMFYQFSKRIFFLFLFGSRIFCWIFRVCLRLVISRTVEVMYIMQVKIWYSQKIANVCQC